MDSCLWKTSGLVYFFLTFIRVATSFDIWTTLCDQLNLECCRKSQIKYNLTSFTNDLSRFHGQPFASSIVPHNLGSHVYLTNSLTKPICFYFHGGTGTGKTFLTNLIIKNIYRYGTSSKFVKVFYLGKDYFEEDNDVSLHPSTTYLKNLMLGHVLSCPKTLFVFDGYSDFWFQIIDTISRHKEYFEKAISIFISDSDVQGMYAYMQKKQNHKNAMDYEDLLEGAVKQNPLLKSANFVYVPFLPMHRDDVHKCISDQLDKLNVSRMPSTRKELIGGITALIEFTNSLSVSGCKKVADKTAFFLAQYNSRQEL